jgi:hypothetical protein
MNTGSKQDAAPRSDAPYTHRLKWPQTPLYPTSYDKDMPDAGPLRPCATCPTVPGFAPAASKVNEWHPVAPYVDKNLDIRNGGLAGQNSCGDLPPQPLFG